MMVALENGNLEGSKWFWCVSIRFCFLSFFLGKLYGLLKADDDVYFFGGELNQLKIILLVLCLLAWLLRQKYFRIFGTIFKQMYLRSLEAVQKPWNIFNICVYLPGIFLELQLVLNVFFFSRKLNPIKSLHKHSQNIWCIIYKGFNWLKFNMKMWGDLLDLKQLNIIQFHGKMNIVFWH